jgi:hypothetical protein
VPIPSVCVAPQEIAAALLRAEGFTEVRYVDTPYDAIEETIARGEVDFAQNFAIDHVSAIDRGLGITVLTGVHVGCSDVFGKKDFRGFADLKGKRVGVPSVGTDPGCSEAVVNEFGRDAGRDRPPSDDCKPPRSLGGEARCACIGATKSGPFRSSATNTLMNVCNLPYLTVELPLRYSINNK